MKNYLILFVILTAVTGIVGFAGLSFSGIEVIRVLFLIFADLLIVTALAWFFFADSRKLKLQRIKR